jgi:hypothetical protein
VANYRREHWMLVDICVWLSLAMTLLSGVDYARRVTSLLGAAQAAEAGARSQDDIGPRGRQAS